MAAIEIKNLTKRFGSTVAVDAVDLHIEHREFVSLLGPSGCGKTTTLRVIAGFLRPDGGEVVVGGRALSSARKVVQPEDRNMSMIFQSYAVWPHKTVFQNVAYGLELRKVSRAVIQEKVSKMLQMVRLGPLAERYPGEISGGQQQRVALARALVVEPEILLLDEPLSNLDANLREEMRFEIRRLHDEFSITTVYVTHDQAEAMVTSDRIVVMNHGKVEQVGTAEEIYRTPATAFVAGFIGRVNMLEGRFEGEGWVESPAGRLVAETDGWRDLKQGDRVLFCVRPHDVHMLAASPASRGDHGAGNLLRGRVKRRVYLGETRDYLVALESGNVEIRAVTSPDAAFSMGEEVAVQLTPSKCRILAAS